MTGADESGASRQSLHDQLAVIPLSRQVEQRGLGGTSAIEAKRRKGRTFSSSSNLKVFEAAVHDRSPEEIGLTLSDSWIASATEDLCSLPG